MAKTYRKDRRTVLTDRLRELVRRVNEDKLPLPVLRIAGIGSFFRAKGTPGDIDLYVAYDIPKGQRGLYDGVNERIDAVRKLLKPLIREASDLYNNDLASRPWPSGTPADVLVKKGPEYSEIAVWLEGIPWTTLYRQAFIGYWFDATALLKHVLNRGLPGISVFSTFGANGLEYATMPNLSTKVEHTVWSTAARDFDTNMAAIQDVPTLTKNIVDELHGFDADVYRLSIQRDRAKTLLQALAKARHCDTPVPEEEWLVAKVKKTKDDIWEWVTPSFEKKYDGFVRRDYSEHTVESLAALVEERRVEIKRVRGERDIYLAAIWAVSAVKRRARKYFERISVNEIIVMREDGSSWRGDSSMRKKVAYYLQNAGLGQENFRYMPTWQAVFVLTAIRTEDRLLPMLDSFRTEVQELFKKDRFLPWMGGTHLEIAYDPDNLEPWQMPHTEAM